MAGHRRTRGTDRALVVRSTRRKQWFQRSLAQATTPAEQVGAAAGYAMGLLVWLDRQPEYTAEAANRIVAAITTVADDLVAAAERNQR